MQLAIPSPPRQVTLAQVPGAVRRLQLTALLVGAGFLLAWVIAFYGVRWLSSEHAFLSRAQTIEGHVSSVKLPELRDRELKSATISVLYTVGGNSMSATVSAPAIYSETLFKGAPIALLVDPADPDHPRSKEYVDGQNGLTVIVWLVLGLAFFAAMAILGREVRRAVKSELEPLRLGMLVWLTPDDGLTKEREETVFVASYWRDDKQYKVRARARPGRAPVRNGEKVLAAVVPSQPTWVRVIDEDLAKTLGWFR